MMRVYKEISSKTLDVNGTPIILFETSAEKTALRSFYKL